MFRGLSTAEFVARAREVLPTVKDDMYNARRAFSGLKEWVNEKKDAGGVKFIPESAIGLLATSFELADDAEALEDEELEEVLDNMQDFFDSVTPAELDLTTRYVIKTAMSDNLLRMFGFMRDPSSEIAKVDMRDWVAPSQHGLDNSSPIIAKEANTGKKQRVESGGGGGSEAKDSEDSDSGPSERAPKRLSFSNDLLSSIRGRSPAQLRRTSIEAPASAEEKMSSAFVDSKGSFGDNKFTAYGEERSSKEIDPVERAEQKQQEPREEKSEVAEGEEEEDEEDGDDEEDDEEEEEEEEELDEESSLKGMNMSANLMAALGMDTSNVDTKTDWTPPQRTGLDNSRAIIEDQDRAEIRRFVRQDDPWRISRGRNQYNPSRSSFESADSKDGSGSTPYNPSALAMAMNNSDSKGSSSSFASTSVGGSSLSFAADAKDAGSSYNFGREGSERKELMSAAFSKDIDEKEEAEEEEEEDEEDDDDEDDDEEEEEEEEVLDEESSLKGMTMSANLMAALGMDTSNVDTKTDWTPPQRTGLDNSRAIIEDRDSDAIRRFSHK